MVGYALPPAGGFGAPAGGPIKPRFSALLENATGEGGEDGAHGADDAVSGAGDDADDGVDEAADDGNSHDRYSFG